MLFDEGVKVMKERVLERLPNSNAQFWADKERLVRLLDGGDPNVQVVKLLFNELVKVVFLVEHF